MTKERLLPQNIEAEQSVIGAILQDEEARIISRSILRPEMFYREDHRMIYEAAGQGDAFSLRFIDETADYLAIGVTTIVHMLDPGLVVLGGAMNFGGKGSPVGRRFLDRVKQSFLERSFEHVGNGTTIDFASRGGDAGYLGAAGIARTESPNQR